MFVFPTGYELLDAQVESWTKFFCRTEFSAVDIEYFFIFFYVLNFSVVFFMHL
jgi:hypothetical protein